MERSVVDRSVAEERDGDIVCLQNLEAVSAAARLQDARADDTTGAHHPDLGSEQVHAAAASERDSGLPSEQLGDQLFRFQPLGQSVPVTSVRAEDDVVIVEASTHSGGDGLFADVSVARTEHQTLLVVTRELLFRLADRLHGPVERQGGIAIQCWFDF